MNEGLIGVIIGGILGLFGGVISQYIQIINKRKFSLIEKKEQTYLKAINIITLYLSEVYMSKDANKSIPQKLRIELNGIKPSMTIYGTEEIYEYFIEIIMKITNPKSFNEAKDEDVSEMIETFNQMILKDLKI